MGSKGSLSDVYTELAAALFNKRAEDITTTERQKAKSFYYCFAYSYTKTFAQFVGEKQ